MRTMLKVRPTGLKLGTGLCLLLAIAPATAGVYKCMDPEGRVAFSDVPCPHGAKAEQIEIVSQPSTASPNTDAPSNTHSTSTPAEKPNRDRSGDGTAKAPRTTKHSAVYEQWLKEEKKAIIQGRPPDVTGNSSATPTRSR